jgi:hypothetical protein
MSLDTLLPKCFRCPECGTQLHEILYGMLAEPPKANQVAGGCEWSDDAPIKLCPSCKWEGGALDDNGKMKWQFNGKPTSNPELLALVGTDMGSQVRKQKEFQKFLGGFTAIK